MKLLTVDLQPSFSSGTQAPSRYLTVTHSAFAAVETKTSSAATIVAFKIASPSRPPVPQP